MATGLSEMQNNAKSSHNFKDFFSFGYRFYIYIFTFSYSYIPFLHLVIV